MVSETVLDALKDSEYADIGFPFFFALDLLSGFWLWWCFCRGKNRQGFSRKVLCEATFCWPYLWADTSVRAGGTTAARAWMYVATFCAFLVAFSVGVTVYFHFGKEASDLYFLIWVSAFGLFWFVWAFQRCSGRRFLTRKADPKLSSEGWCSLDDGCADCCVGLFCFQAAILQEAQILADLEAGFNPVLLGEPVPQVFEEKQESEWPAEAEVFEEKQEGEWPAKAEAEA